METKRMQDDLQPPTNGRTVRVLILDDHEWTRSLLASQLNRQPGLEVVGQGETCLDDVSETLGLHPDVVLLECKGHRCGALPSIHALCRAQRGVRVIILTSYLDEDERDRVLAAGAHAYLLKEIDTRRLATAIRALAVSAPPETCVKPDARSQDA